MTPRPQPLEGSTHLSFPLSLPSLQGPQPENRHLPGPPALPPGPRVLSLASASPSPLSVLTGLALLSPGAGRRRGRCGAATSLQLVRWGRRRGGHGVGDPGQQRRGTDAPSGCTMARKGRQGRRRPPRGRKPDVRRGGGAEPRRQLHARPASPPASGRSHRKRNSAWQPPLRSARRGSEARARPSPERWAGRAVPRRKPGGGRLQPGSAACRLAREDGSPSALRLGRTIPRRGAAAGVHAGPSRLGSGCPRSHPASVPAADTNIPWHGGPVRPTPPHPPTRIPKFSLSATQASPGEAESGLRPPLQPWGAPRANNKLRQRPRGRGRRNMDFNEDSSPLL